MAAKKKRKAKKKATTRPEWENTVHHKGGGSKPGHRTYHPTDKDRKQVEIMVSLGLTQLQIAAVIQNSRTIKSIGIPTLTEKFADELASEGAKIKAKIGQSIIARALDMQHPQGAVCAIFFAKTRMGWSEKRQLEVTSKSGVLVVPCKMSPEEWIAAQEAANDEREPPE